MSAPDDTTPDTTPQPEQQPFVVQESTPQPQQTAQYPQGYGQQPPQGQYPQGYGQHPQAPYPVQPYQQPGQYPVQPYAQPAYAQPAYVQPVYAAPYPYTPSPPRGLSISSMVIGLVSLVFGFTFVLPLIGFVLGILGARKEPAGRAMAVTGIVLNGLFVLVWAGLILLWLLLIGGVFVGGVASSTGISA